MPAVLRVVATLGALLQRLLYVRCIFRLLQHPPQIACRTAAKCPIRVVATPSARPLHHLPQMPPTPVPPTAATPTVLRCSTRHKLPAALPPNA